MKTASALRIWWEDNSNNLIWTALIAAGLLFASAFVRP
jgi:hypothetical protein